MQKKRIQINIKDFPPELHFALSGANLYDSSCSSNADVLYSDLGYYIKIDGAGELRNEAALTATFYEKGLGVEIVTYLSGNKDYMVTREAVGEDMTHWLEDPERVCKVLAGALRTFHSQPIDGVPVSSGKNGI